jgi:membrane-associated protease RseP (regulator of RpoE activity)
LAVGNPFNLTSTVTAGIVSAKARNIGINSPFSIESFIQTDAAVNPGNSGGALVNVRGELVGINTAIASQTGSYVGYSFAVPSNIVKKVVSDFIKYGEVQRAYLGVNILPVDQELAKEKNLATTQGVYVQGVYDNGSAKDAGIQPGDVIVSINNNPVKDIPQLQEQIGQFEPGQRVSVSFLRGSKEMTADVILKNTKNSTDIIKSSYSKALGAKLQTATPDDLRRLRINGGAKVVEVLPGKLKSVGIKPGFIIAAINKQTIKTAEEAELMLSQIKGNVMIEGMYPNGMYAYFSFWNN